MGVLGLGLSVGELARLGREQGGRHREAGFRSLDVTAISRYFPPTRERHGPRRNGQLVMKTNRRSERLSADVLSVLRDSVQDKIFPGAVAALISSTDETYIPFGFETYDPTARP